MCNEATIGEIYMATKHTSACLQKAGNDEPIFVLRAQDITAVDAIQAWIDANVKRLGFTHPKLIEACNIRNEMEAWPNRKLPD